MNEFKKQIAQQVYHRVERELEVVRISGKISELIGVCPEDLTRLHEETRVKLGKYDIVNQHRVFAQGWVFLWEIVQRGEDSWHPAWSDFHGTATINLPPNHVVEEVFAILRGNIGQLSSAEELPYIIQPPPYTYKNITYKNITPQQNSGCLPILIIGLITILWLFI